AQTTGRIRNDPQSLMTAGLESRSDLPFRAWITRLESRLPKNFGTKPCLEYGSLVTSGLLENCYGVRIESGTLCARLPCLLPVGDLTSPSANLSNRLGRLQALKLFSGRLAVPLFVCGD